MLNKGTGTRLSDLPDILTARDIADYLCIGYVKALHLIKYDEIPSIRVGNSVRIYRKGFEQWLEDKSKYKK